MASAKMRQNALAAAEARRRGSLPPKVTTIETVQDRKPFLDLVNRVIGSKPPPEDLQLLQLLKRIAARARECYINKEPECRVRAGKLQGLLRSEPGEELFRLMGFRRKVDENEELYTIPALAARPSIALALLNTAITVLDEEIGYLEGEQRHRREMAERERLAEKAAREIVLQKIQDDRRRVAQRTEVPTSPRFEPHSDVLGS